MDQYLQIIKMKAVCVLQGEAVSGTVYFEQVSLNLFLGMLWSRVLVFSLVTECSLPIR